MGQRLADAAVRGVSNRSTLSPEQIALLTDGDIEGVLSLHSSLFGSAVMMADEDDEDDSDEDDDTEDGDDDEDEDEDDEDDDSDDEDDEDDEGKSKKLDPKDARIKDLSAEAKKNRLKASQRGKRVRELEAEVARLKGAGKKSKSAEDGDEDDEPTGPTAREEALTRKNEELQIRVEFMADSTYSWRDPKAALKLLNLSDVEIDEDGDIEGLDDAIEQLAKDYPFLLAETPKEKQDRKAEQQRRSQGRTGQATKTARKGSKASRDKLAAKYNLSR